MPNVKNKKIVAILIIGLVLSIIALANLAIGIIARDGLFSDGGQMFTGIVLVIIAIILFCWDILVLSLKPIFKRFQNAISH
ncbi:MAG: hypothetical protein KAI71_01705 [Candidatus Pacebacteria bacterium]|nr:hypothetical protein [Candidatus Paceibacterota bacterium]